jgi:membrane protease YdiL (CAAX protease family)
MSREDPCAGDQPVRSETLPVEPPVPLPVQPAGPRLPGWGMLAAGVAIIWGFQFIIGVAHVVVRTIVYGPNSLEADMGPFGVVITTLLSTAITFAVIWFIICRLCRLRFAEGFAAKPVRPPVFVASVFLGLLTALAAFGIESRWGPRDSFMARLLSMPDGFLAVSVLALVMPPFEELYYRGFIFPILKRWLGAWPAVVLVTVWFASAHVFQMFGDPVGLAVILAVGLLYTLQRHLTGSLIPAIIAHWVYNAYLMVLAALFSSPRF